MNNNELRDALIGLALIIISLLLLPTIITKVLLLAVFSVLVVVCIIQFRRTANWAMWALLFAGIVISGYTAVSLLFFQLPMKFFGLKSHW